MGCGSLAGGLGLGAGGEILGVGLDLTGAGAVIGVPVNVLSAGVIATCVGVAGMGKQLNDWPINGLKEVTVIDKSGSVVSLYP
ncbi:hypothetical protein ACFWP2_15665 [Kitasatospora sp. NPDC058444]|uniref:hypothetical protein n=1 Tax=Kitasatospora sp. NPDC058444 TaxID=3346504 RepID=UPI00364FB20F